MGRKRDGVMIPCPLSEEQRSRMFELARLAKERGVLEGWERKIVFEGGKYDTWFASRVETLRGILGRYVATLGPDADGADTRVPLEILGVLSNTELPDAVVGPPSAREALAALWVKYRHGRCDRPERLMLAEMLFEVGRVPEANDVATALLAECPGNQAVSSLVARMKRG